MSATIIIFNPLSRFPAHAKPVETIPEGKAVKVGTWWLTVNLYPEVLEYKSKDSLRLYYARDHMVLRKAWAMNSKYCSILDTPLDLGNAARNSFIGFTLFLLGTAPKQTSILGFYPLVPSSLAWCLSMTLSSSYRLHSQSFLLLVA